MCIARQKMAPSDLFIKLGLSQKRKLTDVTLLIIFAICVFILMLIAVIYIIGSSHTKGFVLNELNDKLGFLAIIGLGLSLMALFCFRYFVNVFVWTVMIVTVLLMCALIVFFWYFWAQQDSLQQKYFLMTAIILTPFPFITTICILVWNDRIKLLIKFYEEAIKIVFAMPLLFLVSLLTFISVLVIAALCRYMIVLLNNAGERIRIGGFFGIDDGTIFMQVFVVLVLLWMVQFVLACQQIVISGAVATYYFTRDKTALVSPIYSSFYNLIRYHLGTAVFGSIKKFGVTARKNYFTYVRCCSILKLVLQYKTSKGLIVTAIRGEPLCQSGGRAVNLIVSNFLSAVGMSWVGDFVFFTVKLLVVAITTLIGYSLMIKGRFDIFEFYVEPVVIGAVFAFFCAHCIFVVFEIAVETVLICYCEDYCLNNGTKEPFYATVEFHQKVKEVQDFTKSIKGKNCVC